MKLRFRPPCRGLQPPAPRGATQRLSMLLVGLLMTTASIAHAQPRPRGEPKAGAAAKETGKDSPAKDGSKDGSKDGGKDNGKPKVFDFTGIDLAGQLHTPQLLYFLERASEELDRAFLERRTFIPNMVRSLDEEAL
jgi:hypothetical protein